jgi:glycosyltransferase involved in cell wall biosynthesis
MKIACISASRIPSTTANSIQVMKACQALSQLGHEVHLFLPEFTHQSNNMDLAAFYGLKTLFPIEWLSTRPSLHRYDLAFKAVQKTHLLKSDICYVWFLQAGIFSLLAHLPVIIELHGPPEGRFGSSLFRLFQLFPGTKRFLPITLALANQLHDSFNLDLNARQTMQIFPNGVDLERYANLPEPTVARKLLNLPSTLTIGYTGHLYPGRGMSIMIELARCFPSINFLWVGGRKEDVDSWRTRLAADNISNITLTGFVENNQLPLFQAAADILLMPYESIITGSSGGNSISYASPMKMFEYMASKRAIISSDLPVIREILNPSNAMLCPAEAIDDWSQALGGLIHDEDKRHALAKQAWLDVQQYTWIERARKALAEFPSQPRNVMTND